MGITKTDLFTAKQNAFAQMGKIFSHPARIAILEHLIQANACINSDLVAELGLAQPTISQHLKELKSIWIIKGTVEGVSMSYCIDAEKWEEFKAVFSEFFGQKLPSDTNQCC